MNYPSDPLRGDSPTVRRPRPGLYSDFRNPEPRRRDPTAYCGRHLDLIEEADDAASDLSG